MILIGAQALEASEFLKKEEEKFKLGALVRVRVPLGQYDEERLINIGTNRFSTKIGVAYLALAPSVKNPITFFQIQVSVDPGQ